MCEDASALPLLVLETLAACSRRACPGGGFPRSYSCQEFAPPNGQPLLAVSVPRVGWMGRIDLVGRWTSEPYGRAGIGDKAYLRVARGGRGGDYWPDPRAHASGEVAMENGTRAGMVKVARTEPSKAHRGSASSTSSPSPCPPTLQEQELGVGPRIRLQSWRVLGVRERGQGRVERTRTSYAYNVVMSGRA